MNSLGEIINRYSPTFAAPSASLRTCLASLRRCSGHALREIFRVSVAASPRWVSVVKRIRISHRRGAEGTDTKVKEQKFRIGIAWIGGFATAVQMTVIRPSL